MNKFDGYKANKKTELGFYVNGGNWSTGVTSFAANAYNEFAILSIKTIIFDNTAGSTNDFILVQIDGNNINVIKNGDYTYFYAQDNKYYVDRRSGNSVIWGINNIVIRD